MKSFKVIIAAIGVMALLIFVGCQPASKDVGFDSYADVTN